MSATNSRIAKLNRALRELNDYDDHKVNWTDKEYTLSLKAQAVINELITAEKLRRAA